jgi:hypothetical protein
MWNQEKEIKVDGGLFGKRKDIGESEIREGNEVGMMKSCYIHI